VRETLTLSWDGFGWESLERRARAEGSSLDELISRAAAYRHSELGRNRFATLVPPASRTSRGREAAVELALPAGVWSGCAGKPRISSFPSSG